LYPKNDLAQGRRTFQQGGTEEKRLGFLKSVPAGNPKPLSRVSKTKNPWF